MHARTLSLVFLMVGTTLAGCLDIGREDPAIDVAAPEPEPPAVVMAPFYLTDCVWATGTFPVDAAEHSGRVPTGFELPEQAGIAELLVLLAHCEGEPQNFVALPGSMLLEALVVRPPATLEDDAIRTHVVPLRLLASEHISGFFHVNGIGDDNRDFDSGRILTLETGPTITMERGNRQYALTVHGVPGSTEDLYAIRVHGADENRTATAYLDVALLEAAVSPVAAAGYVVRDGLLEHANAGTGVHGVATIVGMHVHLVADNDEVQDEH